MTDARPVIIFLLRQFSKVSVLKQTRLYKMNKLVNIKFILINFWLFFMRNQSILYFIGLLLKSCQGRSFHGTFMHGFASGVVKLTF